MVLNAGRSRLLNTIIILARNDRHLESIKSANDWLYITCHKKNFKNWRQELFLILYNSVLVTGLIYFYAGTSMCNCIKINGITRLQGLNKPCSITLIKDKLYVCDYDGIKVFNIKENFKYKLYDLILFILVDLIHLCKLV